MTDTANLGLPFIDGSQAQKHITHNEALRILDGATQIGVLDVTRTAPPSSPVEGQRHIVAASPTGAWMGQAKNIAVYQDATWRFLAPKLGWCAWCDADSALLVYNGTAWIAAASGGGGFSGSVSLLGINDTATAPNLLTVKSNAALFNAVTVANGGTGDARVQISKESSAKTASVVFSDAFSGRAEFGLVGSDAFKLKVSNDGSTFVEAFNIDQTTGNLSLPRGVSLTGVISPAQITSNQNDYNPTGLATASIVNLSSDAARNVSGLAGGAEGRVVSLLNTGNQIITLLDESASSTAANRFTLGADLAVGGKQAVMLRYDGTAARWYALARPGSSGSGQLMAASNLSDLASSATARVNLGIRDVLTANRTYYVRTDGSNSNDGLSNTSGGAFLTIQKAYDVIVSRLDLSGFTVTIQIADGTYTGGLSIAAPWSGGGTIVVQGNSGTPSNVLISVTSNNAIANSSTLPGKLTVKDLKLQSATSGALLLNSGVGLIEFSNIVFGAAAGSGHIVASGPAARITGAGNYSITGGGSTHNESIYGGLVLINGVTVTITGNPTFSSAFAFAWRTGTVDVYGNTYSVTGSVTGVRSNAVENGVIITGGQSNTAYPPGSSNGVTSSGGQRT